jgi:hypothetical protein
MSQELLLQITLLRQSDGRINDTRANNCKQVAPYVRDSLRPVLGFADGVAMTQSVDTPTGSGMNRCRVLRVIQHDSKINTLVVFTAAPCSVIYGRAEIPSEAHLRCHHFRRRPCYPRARASLICRPSLRSLEDI